MFKNVIIKKKKEILLKLETRNDESDDKFKEMTCVDCSQKGHVIKKFYKCTLYKEASASDVGTSRKRKQTFQVKEEKSTAKRQATSQNMSFSTCKSCKQVGRSTARSKSCPNRVLSKQEVLEANLGSKYQAYNRKVPFNSITNNAYKDILKNKIIESSRYIRQIVIRAMVFTNHLIIKDVESVPECIFQQNYWYSVCQLVGGRKVTNSILTTRNTLATWDAFRARHPKATYTGTLLTGASQPLTAACVELATIYRNNIVENFENRLLYYFRHRLQNTFITTRPRDIKEIAEKYYYQLVCGVNPIWENSWLLTEEHKEKIDGICLPMKERLPMEATLVTLSKHTEKFVPLLADILSYYETEHTIRKPYDVSRLPLPRLFGLFPNPSAHFRSITMNISAICAFLSLPLPKTYNDQLAVFQRLLKFDKLRYSKYVP